MISAVLFSLVAAIAFVLLDPSPALAWGPVTHISLGIQALATVRLPTVCYKRCWRNFREAFLYGGLAPDICAGAAATVCTTTPFA
jgi:hypothetical protein